MAERVVDAFLSSFFDVTLERLASSDLIDYFRRGKLDRLVEELENKLRSFNQVLDEAEIKQYQIAAVKEWLDDLKHALYEADQLLDEVATDAPLKKLRAESQPASRRALGFFSSAFTNSPFESRIKELLQNLDSLADQKDKLEFKERTGASNEGRVSWRSSDRYPPSSLPDESRTYGRDGDKEKIITFLLSPNVGGSGAPIISIVGLGDMGKTTLAQLVYNDPRIKESFELKAWVLVSESFDVVGLTKAILGAFKPPAVGESFNDLQNQLQQALRGKKYLLVLDDVWIRDSNFWECLLRSFIHRGSSGSKIIVTTRDREVASVMESAQIHDLKLLEDSHCWSLFVRHAFHGKNESERQELESIGKKIVDKCGGLPIAVKTLGKLLRRKFSKREWDRILEIDMWHLSEDSDINPTLRLSYHNLHSNLKRCFAYCSAFRKGRHFEKDGLIKLWMAEGLLKCCGTDKSEEELGNEFFDDLVSISFFQQSRRGQSFIMHDLVNDLAKSVSGEFCLQIKGDRVQSIPERTRHIWCFPKLTDVDKILEHISKINGLRSLMVEAQSCGDQRFMICNNVPHDLFSRQKYLRMLSFRGCGISKLADEISNLKLLRYLDLSKNVITSLPDSICTLYNLQTLILTRCPLTELPSDFYRLVNLRHLHLELTRIKKMPKHIGRLVHLRTLALQFVLGEQSGFDIKELANLSHLQGTLCISGLENVTDPAHAAKANLKDKKHLEELCMTYSISREIDDGSIIERDVSVLEALQPNSNLNRLDILFYRGSSFPNWLGDCCRHLPNLVSLELSGCIFCTRLPSLGQLPYLKKLSITRCDGIEIIGEEFYSNNNSSNVSFRSLESLEFRKMSKWEEWLCLEGFPLLKELYITECPKLKRALPQRLPSLQRLEIMECQELEASIPKAANITNLHSLELFRCPRLEFSPGGGLPSSLSSLEIFTCPKLVASREEWGLFNLHSLKELTVEDDFENVESFPEECLLPPTLESLRLCYCSKLRIINYRGLLHLKSLKSLEIWNCPCLECLPEEGLPNSLSTLRIYHCPLLKQLYQKEEGERWHKIRHIPSVLINFKRQE